MDLLLSMDKGLKGINPYSILDPCYTDDTEDAERQTMAEGPGSRIRTQPPRALGLPRAWQQLGAARLGHAVACADRRVALAWVDRPDVRLALHAQTVEELAWTPCSDVIDYDIGAADMIPVHKELIMRGLRVLVYSGDHDYVVPYTGSRAWVYGLGLHVDKPYSPWLMDGQVAGYYTQMQHGFVFATVKGAGHMVPQTSPRQGLELVARFLSGAM